MKIHYVLLLAVTIISCASNSIRDTLQLSSTCPHACVPGKVEVDPNGCCYDKDGYGWSGCAWNACGWNEKCRTANLHWDSTHPENAPCGSVMDRDGSMVPTPCQHPDGRILVPVTAR